MGNPYDSQSASGYNSSPPADDGTQTEANRVKWSTIKTKLGDPVKTLADAINTAVSTAFGKIALNNVTVAATSYTVQSSDQGKLIRVTGSATITTPSAATVGAPFMFSVRNDHSAAITLDGSGSETIDGSATISIPANNAVLVMTDGTNWFTASTLGIPISDAQDQTYVYAADSGAADAYVITLAQAPTAYAAGQKFAFKAGNANTGASTLNVNSLGAKNIFDFRTLAALLGDEIEANGIYEVVYDGTQFLLLNPSHDITYVLDADPTESEIVSTASETTMYSFTVPGNTLGTDKSLRLTLRGDYLNNTGTNQAFTLKIKYGATTLYDASSGSITANASRRVWALDIMLSAVDSASAQIVNATMQLGGPSAPTTGIGAMFSGASGAFEGTASEDSTGDLALTVTITHSASSSNLSWRRKQAVLEVLP